MLCTSKGQTILNLVSLPFAWEDLIIIPYGFLVLPWYTVVICATAAVLAVGLFWDFFLSNVVSRYGLFVAILFSYPIALLTAAWYFGYLGKEHVISPGLGSYIGIAVLLGYRILNALYTMTQR